MISASFRASDEAALGLGGVEEELVVVAGLWDRVLELWKMVKWMSLGL